MMSGTGGASMSSAPKAHAAITLRMNQRRPSRATIQPVIGAMTVPTR